MPENLLSQCVYLQMLSFFIFPFFSSVKPKAVLGSRPDPISITEGETLQLNCTVHSNPSPAYMWTGPDNTTVGSVLTVQSVDFKHAGQYVCAASNNQGSTTMKFNVDVRGVFNVFNLSASEAQPFLILETWSSFIVRPAPTLI